MKSAILWRAALFTCGSSLPFFQLAAQSRPDANPTPPSNLTAEYPNDCSGVLIKASDWIELSDVPPSRTEVKHALAHALTSGAVPAAAVSVYDGTHAVVKVPPGRPILCICHMPLPPGAPVLVRLHPKKDSRELQAGRLSFIGSKVAEATARDLVAVEVSRPESTVWLVRPREALSPGEYALMLGTQNMSIFPFTVSIPAKDSSAPVPGKH